MKRKIYKSFPTKICRATVLTKRGLLKINSGPAYNYQKPIYDINFDVTDCYRQNGYAKGTN